MAACSRGACKTGSVNAGLLCGGAAALPSNEFGFRKYKTANAARSERVAAAAASACGAATAECHVNSSGALVAAYESATLTNFMANTVVDGAGNVQHNVRIIGSASLGGETFCTGVALSSSLWTPQGFVAVPSGACVSLRSTTSLGTSVLTQPNAMCAVPDRGVLVIVGTGEMQPADGSASNGTHPAVALVALRAGTVSCVTVFIGAGPTELPYEVYTGVCIDADAAASACCPTTTVDVCGSYTSSPSTQSATFRRLQIDNNFQPVVFDSGDSVQTLSSATGGISAAATCVAESSALGFVLLGVVYYAAPSDARRTMQSGVWTLQSDGTPVPTGSSGAQLTGFNTSSNTLPLPSADVGGTVVLRIVLATAACRIYVVAAAYSNTDSVLLPPATTLVYAFGADTNPAVTFGAFGVLMWYANGFGAAVPQDAVLDASGTALLVTGDCFCTLAPRPSTSTILEYAFGPSAWWRSVLVPQTDGEYLTSPPAPFLIRCTDSGACPLLVGVPGSPASALVFVSTLVSTPLSATELLGDWSTTPTGIDQPAGLLDIQLRGANVLNCGQTAVPVLQTAPDGVVTLDARSALLPTTLIVNGPIVPGYTDQTPAALGAIRFDPVTQTFQGYTSAGWQTFSFTT